MYIGLMSGTSADGIDAALVRIQGEQISLQSYREYPLDPTLRKALLELNTTPQISLQKLCELEFAVASAFSQASRALLQENAVSAEQIRAIGSHGQTIYHAPQVPMSLQIGHPAFIAKQTCIDTVADFRIDDLAVGGQGAPLAPAFHQALFKPQRACCVLNIGGIANISYLDPAAGRVAGFDTGAGNGLMDEICQRHFNREYDRNGEIAATGRVNQALLQTLLTHPYLQAPYPKSTGRDTFNIAWLDAQLQNTAIAPQDLLATLSEFTAASVAVAVNQLGVSQGDLWVVGGGAYNSDLLARLQKRLPALEVASSLSVNIHPNAVEAMMCAWLARQRIHNRTIALTDITGARRNVVLGGLWSGI
nr:anhydro-N-acetylmuramic acid kinase [Thiomicrorhabdus cannonii]